MTLGDRLKAGQRILPVIENRDDDRDIHSIKDGEVGWVGERESESPSRRYQPPRPNPVGFERLAKLGASAVHSRL